MPSDEQSVTGGIVRRDEQTLLALWQHARALALRTCARSLARLRRGEGGFYEADDLLQDLFIEFWGLFERWRRAPCPREADLWAAWQRTLWGGGCRLLRRAPQRLWAGREWTVAPEVLMLDRVDADLAAPLPPAALAALVAPDEAEAAPDQAWRWDEVMEALWALRPLYRQTLYLHAVAGLDAAEVARCLGLPDSRVARQWLYQARVALRRQLATHRQRAGVRPRPMRVGEGGQRIAGSEHAFPRMAGQTITEGSDAR